MLPSTRLSRAMCLVIVLSSPYAHADSLRVVVENGTPVPDRNATFLSFADNLGVSPDISGGNIVFDGLYGSGSGFFAWMDGKLILIADTQTPMPGTDKNFGFAGFYGSQASISGRRIAFFARSSVGASLWVWSEGNLEMIAATSVTPVPGGTGTYRSFDTLNGASPSISGENLAFKARYRTPEGQVVAGIYAYIDGELRLIADVNTQVPGRNVTFNGFGGSDSGTSPAISGENVAFGATSPEDGGGTRFGIYAHINGELIEIMDSHPNFATFGFLDGMSPSISGENVAFNTGGSGIYAIINGDLLTIAGTNTLVPGGTEPFLLFPVSPRICGENVVFGAKLAGSFDGIYAHIDGELVTIADESTSLPGQTATFVGFGKSERTSPGISGTNVVFSGFGGSTLGIFTNLPAVPPVPGQSDWSVMGMTLILLAAASAIILRRLLSAARRAT